MNDIPFFTSEIEVLGILAIVLVLVFATANSNNPFFKKFYAIFPALLLCYLIPAILVSTGVIAESWTTVVDGKEVENKLGLYTISSRILLPAALIYTTLSVDLKAIKRLGFKALGMFLFGTLGIIIGGPIAVLIIGSISPEVVGGSGNDAVWRGLSTIAGSWIGGGANQTAMLEIYQYNPDRYGAMVLVDIVVANAWMAIILFGIAFRDKWNKFFKADAGALQVLQEKSEQFSRSVQKVATTYDYMKLTAVGIGGTALASWSAGFFVDIFTSSFDITDNVYLSFLNSEFFWVIAIATLIGLLLSYTPIKNLEGAGASKIGSLFIYILVLTIGMKIDLSQVYKEPGLLAVGLIWILVHALVLVGGAKLLKAPYFYFAVGSQANVGGAASAPVVAAEFHPSLASVGVLLAVLGYIAGTIGAILCTILMQAASNF